MSFIQFKFIHLSVIFGKKITLGTDNRSNELDTLLIVCVT